MQLPRAAKWFDTPPSRSYSRAPLRDHDHRQARPKHYGNIQISTLHARGAGRVAVAPHATVALQRRARQRPRGERALTSRTSWERCARRPPRNLRKPWADLPNRAFLCVEESVSRGDNCPSQASLRRRSDSPNRRLGGVRRSTVRVSAKGPSGALTLPIARCVPSVLCAPNLLGISSAGRAQPGKLLSPVRFRHSNGRLDCKSSQHGS